ncbi:hypothetical protein FAM09_23095 [Niastella caeni]|uniref:Uncharacterized protein n=1 Tax=Niastella caeni TaxID=2569763 RepID=A0A4S8HPF1_9BACT|nr:hypothetical protein [Niastella caeni]THU34882.1 hypothetical protein FAM09_23095 [Niastella caeni]
MSFDIAVGVNQRQLNQCSQDLVASVPGLFSGSGSDPSYPGISMTWNTIEAPVFNLSPAGFTIGPKQEIVKTGMQFFTDQLAPFDVNFSNLQIILEQKDGDKIQLNINVTLSCFLYVLDNKLNLGIDHASYEHLPDPMENIFVSKYVMPQLLDVAAETLAGLSIPSPDLAGITLSPIVATIEGGSIIAITNLWSNGPAAIPEAFPWPEDDFFALLSNKALQAVTNIEVGTKNISGSGSVGTDVGGASYSYSINILNPVVNINGNAVDMNFGVNGNVSASVTVFFLPIGVNYDVEGGPAPGATAQLEPVGNSSMNIIVRSINPFTFLLKPTGSIWQKILSAITWPITQSIAAVATPIATTFIQNINFETYQLPGYGVSINNVSIQFTPQINKVDNRMGMLCIVGALKTS